MHGKRQKISQALAGEANGRGEPRAGVDTGVEPGMAARDPESPASMVQAQPDRTAVVRDPYARWCGRGSTVRCSPIPLISTDISLSGYSCCTERTSDLSVEQCQWS